MLNCESASLSKERFKYFNMLASHMKRHVIVLISVFLVFVLAASVALASVALPPSDPGNFPPGPFISAEELEKMRQLDNLHKDMQKRLERCRSLAWGPAPGDVDGCIKAAVKNYNDTVRSIVHPPQLILPNGGSPGK